MHTARSEILFLMLQKFITMVFMDCLLVLVGASWVCFLVLSVLLLPDLVLLKLLFLVLSLCLYGKDVARGGLSGSLQSEVEMSDRTEKDVTTLRLRVRRLGIPWPCYAYSWGIPILARRLLNLDLLHRSCSCIIVTV